MANNIMMTLYEIDSRIKAIIDSLYDTVDENGEVGEVDFTELEQLQTNRETKMENIALYIKNLEAEAEAIKKEEDKLKARREKTTRKAESLRNRMIYSMQANNEPEIWTPRCHCKIKTTESTEVTDLNQIPEEFIRIKIPEPERSADKTAIKKAIKAGATIGGAYIKINTKVVIE